jgi:16S rRNA processing protein RimM
MPSYKPPFDPPPGWMEIGTIVSPQGLRGEVRVYPNSDFPERFEVAGQRWLYGPELPAPQPIALERGYFLPGKGLYVVKLGAVNDRDGAEALRNKMLVVPTTDRPRLAPGEFHVADLVGLAVVLQEGGSPVGTVTDLLAAGNTLLVVRQGEQEILIPFVESIVPVVDLAAGRIEITPPPGLLALNQPSDKSSDGDKRESDSDDHPLA